jgi:hypothetical protein
MSALTSVRFTADEPGRQTADDGMVSIQQKGGLLRALSLVLMNRWICLRLHF